MTAIQQTVIAIDVYVVGVLLTCWFLGRPGTRQPLGSLGVAITTALWPLAWAMAVAFALIILVFTKKEKA